MQVFMGSGPAIEMEVFDLPSLKSLWLFLLFGIIVGLVGLLFNKTLMWMLEQLDKLTVRGKFIYVALVGLLMGFLAAYYPSFAGGGYVIINQALSLSPSISVLGLLIIGRFLTTMVSYGTGVPGGIFAPMLALGTLLGLAASYLFNFLMIDSSIHPGMFAVAGMGALFAASVRAPTTGVILVVEMTQNYSLILPLMITCITSTTVMQLARNKPIYTQLLDRTLRSASSKPSEDSP
jgi:CIC family chloride channel protein